MKERDEHEGSQNEGEVCKVDSSDVRPPMASVTSSEDLEEEKRRGGQRSLVATTIESKKRGRRTRGKASFAKKMIPYVNPLMRAQR